MNQQMTMNLNIEEITQEQIETGDTIMNYKNGKIGTVIDYRDDMGNTRLCRIVTSDGYEALWFEHEIRLISKISDKNDTTIYYVTADEIL